MDLRSIGDLGDLSGKRVLVRADFNVPIERGRVSDDTKIKATLPTLRYLAEADARLILSSHLGEGGVSLAPVVARLRSLWPGRRIILLRERIGAAALRARLARFRRGEVAVLENLRSYAGERTNSTAFARALASLSDVYVNDAFAVCHRYHASVVRAPKLLPAAAGLLLEREVCALSLLLVDPKSPFLALLGGVKISTKLPVIERLLEVADAVLLGGALVNNFFAARGYGIGTSFVEPEGIALARKLLRRSARRNLLLPLDVVVGDPNGRRRHPPRVVAITEKPSALCEHPFAILDIGPATIRAYSEQLRSAATIVWNGPMGLFEHPPFHHGSIALARVIASRSSGRAFGVVGGGETLAVLAQTGMARYIDHISTGGGAMLALLAGEKLPGLIPLLRK